MVRTSEAWYDFFTFPCIIAVCDEHTPLTVIVKLQLSKREVIAEVAMRNAVLLYNYEKRAVCMMYKVILLYMATRICFRTLLYTERSDHETAESPVLLKGKFTLE